MVFIKQESKQIFSTFLPWQFQLNSTHGLHNLPWIGSLCLDTTKKVKYHQTYSKNKDSMLACIIRNYGKLQGNQTYASTLKCMRLYYSELQ